MDCMHDKVADECKEAWLDGSTYGKARIPMQPRQVTTHTFFNVNTSEGLSKRRDWASSRAEWVTMGKVGRHEVRRSGYSQDGEKWKRRQVKLDAPSDRRQA